MSSVVQLRNTDPDLPANDAAAPGMEMLGRIVGSVAHDFNNLITGVLLYSDLLSKELPPDSRLQRHVSGIRRAGENGAALIQQMLTVARPHTSGQELLPVGTAIADMYDLLAHLVGENIEIVIEQEPGLGLVRMSSPQFHRVLLNLVLNSRDAMPDGGRITIQARAHAGNGAETDKCEITVTDTGCGISEEVREHLFEPFFTTKRSGSGNGLGLFTIHNIVTQAGGRLEVKSVPGKGTEVQIRLPRTNAKQITQCDRKKR